MPRRLAPLEALFANLKELGLVLGFDDPGDRGRKDVAAGDARALVAGYTVINDVTARKLQGQDRDQKYPWLRAKAIDTFCPTGPFVVPADAIDRRVSMVGTIRELLEAHRLLHVALNGGEPERLTAKLLLAAHLAGLVIGKSAETVREISRQSGASVVVEKQMAAVSGGKLEERLTRRVVPGASQPLLDGPKPRLRLPGGKVLVDGREMDAKQAKGRKRKWRGAAGT